MSTLLLARLMQVVGLAVLAAVAWTLWSRWHEPFSMIPIVIAGAVFWLASQSQVRKMQTDLQAGP